MPDVRIESVGDDKYFIWINGKKQSDTFTLDQCMTMIATEEHKTAYADARRRT